jgi:hypothetical protein
MKPIFVFLDTGRTFLLAKVELEKFASPNPRGHQRYYISAAASILPLYM